MEFEDRSERNVLVLTVLSQRLDAKEANDFKEKISRIVSERGQRIVLNMSQVDFVDSSGLGAMVSILKSVGEEKLAICNIQDSVQRLFKLTRMNRVFNVFDEETQAVQALAAD